MVLFICAYVLKLATSLVQLSEGAIADIDEEGGALKFLVCASVIGVSDFLLTDCLERF